jgi:hypothetical protein
MKERIAETSPQVYARIGGVLYLIIPPQAPGGLKSHQTPRALKSRKRNARLGAVHFAGIILSGRKKPSVTS